MAVQRDAFVGGIPVSKRSRGLLNDVAQTANPAQVPLEGIHVPTLATSVEDDRFGTYDAARYIAAKVTGARLVTYPTGGHIWVGHDEDLFAQVAEFVANLA